MLGFAVEMQNAEELHQKRDVRKEAYRMLTLETQADPRGDGLSLALHSAWKYTSYTVKIMNCFKHSKNKRTSSHHVPPAWGGHVHAS